MLPETLFEGFVHPFTRKPLLIGEKAIECYGLRDGQGGYDFLLPHDEFQALQTTIETQGIPDARWDFSIRIGAYEFFEQQFGLTSSHVAEDATDHGDYQVIHPGFQLLLSIHQLILDPKNRQARIDLLLFLYLFSVIPLESPSQEAAASTPTEPIAALEERMERVDEVVVTRLGPELYDLLKAHGCLIQVGGRGPYCVQFPAQTRRQVLVPPRRIERSRILFANGLELRYKSDPSRAMSLLAVERSEMTEPQAPEE